MTSLPAKVLFFIAASPAVWLAAWRVYRLRDEPFEGLPDRLRDVSRFAVPGLCRPDRLLATVDRWIPFLPPRGYGRCFKRSLMLLDLWSRCGLVPRLHLGTVQDRRDRNFHAWVTTEPDGPRTSDAGHGEIWSG